MSSNFLEIASNIVDQCSRLMLVLSPCLIWNWRRSCYHTFLTPLKTIQRASHLLTMLWVSTFLTEEFGWGIIRFWISTRSSLRLKMILKNFGALGFEARQNFGAELRGYCPLGSKHTLFLNAPMLNLSIPVESWVDNEFTGASFKA